MSLSVQCPRKIAGGFEKDYLRDVSPHTRTRERILTDSHRHTRTIQQVLGTEFVFMPLVKVHFSFEVDLASILFYI